MTDLQVFDFQGAKVRTAGTFDAPLFCAADVVRFKRKVNTNGAIPQHSPSLGQCWEWTASRNRSGRGYGTFGLGGRSVLAHRFAWRLRNGSWPIKCVCHRCDNPACVRPDHLFEGDQRSNMIDAATKGRLVYGSRHPKNKLTTSDVIAIASSSGCPKEMAIRYGVSAVHIRRIRSGAWIPKELRNAPLQLSMALPVRRPAKPRLRRIK